MLEMDVVIVLLNTLPTISQDLQQLLSGAVESLKQIITDLIQSLVKPMYICLAAIFNALLRLELIKDYENLLAQTIIALH